MGMQISVEEIRAMEAEWDDIGIKAASPAYDDLTEAGIPLKDPAAMLCMAHHANMPTRWCTNTAVSPEGRRLCLQRQR